MYQFREIHVWKTTPYPKIGTKFKRSGDLGTTGVVLWNHRVLAVLWSLSEISVIILKRLHLQQLSVHGNRVAREPEKNPWIKCDIPIMRAYLTKSYEKIIYESISVGLQKKPNPVIDGSHHVWKIWDAASMKSPSQTAALVTCLLPESA